MTNSEKQLYTTFHKDEDGDDYTVEGRGGRVIGYAYRDGWGRFVFETAKKHPGPLSELLLREVADKLEELNNKKQLATGIEQTMSTYRDWLNAEILKKVDAQKLKRKTLQDLIDEVRASINQPSETDSALTVVEKAIEEVNALCRRFNADSPFHVAPTLEVIGYQSESGFSTIKSRLIVDAKMENSTPLSNETIRQELERRIVEAGYDDSSAIDIVVNLSVSQR